MPFPAPQAQALQFDNMPLGAVIASPVNLELLNPKRWMALDGGDRLKSDMSTVVAARFPVGVMTSTARTLNATPVVAMIAADGTNFLAPGATGTSPLQASPDATTWSTSATWGASTSACSIIVAGSRFILAGTGGDLSAPYVANTGQTAANIVNKANWTVTTGGFSTSLGQCLAYSSSLALTVGVPSAAGTSVYTLPDGGTAWTGRTVSSQTKTAICWTGSKFVIRTATNLIHTSSDGVTWADSYIPFYVSSSGGIASDGAGTVVMPVSNSAAVFFLVSKDHGSTWRRVIPPIESYIGSSGIFAQVTLNNNVQYINGKFVAFGNTCLWSADGISWFLEDPTQRGANVSTALLAMAYQGGTYCGINATNTSALSATENTGKVRMPCTSVRSASNQSTFPSYAGGWQEYLKVA